MSNTNTDNNILIIGDIMLDKYWYSSSKSLAEEAPVACIDVSATEYRAGGAANVALNIKQLASESVEVAIVAQLGHDEAAGKLKSIFLEHDIKDYCQQLSDTQTITKHRILTNNHQLVRVDFEQGYYPLELNDEVKELIAQYKIIVLSDYNKGFLGNISQIIHYAKSLGHIILVDPKGQDFAKYKGASLLTPNYKEFTDVVGYENLDQKAYDLIADLELEHLLVTLGAKGMALYSKNNGYYRASSYAEQVYDVTGAGDTVLASLAVSFAEGKTKEKAIEYASHAAALVVSQIGTGFARRVDVSNLMMQQIKDEQAGDRSFKDIYKLNDKVEAKNIIAQLKQQATECNFIYWDFFEDNILNAKNIASLMTWHLQQPQKSLCVVIENMNPLAMSENTNPISHNLDELAYCISQLKGVNHVLYSDNFNLRTIIDELVMQQEATETI